MLFNYVRLTGLTRTEAIMKRHSLKNGCSSPIRPLIAILLELEDVCIFLAPPNPVPMHPILQLRLAQNMKPPKSGTFS